MFFVVFLLMTILTKVYPTVVAEQDYYKHYDDYDYVYDDTKLDETDNKQTNRTTYISEATSDEDGGDERHDRTTNKRLLEDTENNKFVPGTNGGKDTNILTEKLETDTARYEVTEIIDDIPNTATFKPIVTNFTIKLPLNNATGIAKGNRTENSENNKGKPRKNSISIFHVNAEFDDEKDKQPTIQNINIHKIPFGIFKVKGDVDKIKDDAFNYVHSTEVYNEQHEEHYFPNIFAAPRHFLRRLREKGSALYHMFF